MRAMHADWVQLPKSYRAGLEMMTWYNEEGQSFLSWIVTNDEMWLHY